MYCFCRNLGLDICTVLFEIVLPQTEKSIFWSNFAQKFEKYFLLRVVLIFGKKHHSPSYNTFVSLSIISRQQQLLAINRVQRTALRGFSTRWTWTLTERWPGDSNTSNIVNSNLINARKEERYPWFNNSKISAREEFVQACIKDQKMVDLLSPQFK